MVLKGTTAPDTFADKMGNFFFFQKRPISVCGGILKVYTKYVGTIFSFLANCEVSISSKKNGNSSRKYFFESISISIVHAYIKYWINQSKQKKTKKKPRVYILLPTLRNGKKRNFLFKFPLLYLENKEIHQKTDKKFKICTYIILHCILKFSRSRFPPSHEKRAGICSLLMPNIKKSFFFWQSSTGLLGIYM